MHHLTRESQVRGSTGGQDDDGTDHAPPSAHLAGSNKREVMLQKYSDMARRSSIALSDLATSRHSAFGTSRHSQASLGTSRHSQRGVNRRASLQRSSASSRRGSLTRSSIATSFRMSVTNITEDSEGLSPFVVTCTIINYVSVGYLFLPWAFAQAGTVLSCLGLFVVSAQSFITATYVMEACARAETLANWSFTEEGNKSGIVVTSEHASTMKPFHRSTTALEDAKKVAAMYELEELSECAEDDVDMTEITVENISQPPPEEDNYNEADKNLDESYKACQENKERLDEAEKVVEQVSQRPKFDGDDNKSESSSSSYVLPGLGESPLQALRVPNRFENSIVRHQAAEDAAQMIGHRRFELSELSRIFLGQRLRALFVLTTACDLYGLTWSFAIVSASSLAENLSIAGDDDQDYWIYMLIFAAIVVPLSCVPIVDQLFVQMTFLVGRMLMVLTMLVTVAVAYRSNTPHFDDQVGATKDVPTFDISELYIMLQIAVFSTAYQFSVPVMAEVSRDRDKLVPVFGGACSYLGISTGILALVLSVFFGRKGIESSSNLNWAGYHGGTGEYEDGEVVDRAPWAKMISGFVVCFPAFDFLAVFPLCAISLGDILMGAWYGADFHVIKDNWKQRTLFRLLASVPQIVGGAFIKDIGAIANYAGIFTVASYSICPSLLAIYSHKLLTQLELSTDTHYKTPFSHVGWAWSICGAATALIVYVVISSAVN